MNINVNNFQIVVNFSKRTNLVKNHSNICQAIVNFTNADKVLDEPRGYLYFNQTQWIFCGLNQITPTNYINLGLILESPHRNEFYNGIPVRPANGITGTKIHNKLANIINLDINNVLQSLNQGVIYKVFIINAIQFQASCFNALSNRPGYTTNWHIIRDAVFKAMWNNRNLNLQQDLINRLNNLNINLVLNCVTGGNAPNGLRSQVGQALNNVVQSIVPLNHPSSW